MQKAIAAAARPIHLKEELRCLSGHWPSSASAYTGPGLTGRGLPTTRFCLTTRLETELFRWPATGPATGAQVPGPSCECADYAAGAGPAHGVAAATMTASPEATLSSSCSLQNSQFAGI